MGDLLDAEDETILKWESDERGPPAIVQQVLTWIWQGDVPAELVSAKSEGLESDSD